MGEEKEIKSCNKWDSNKYELLDESRGIVKMLNIHIINLKQKISELEIQIESQDISLETYRKVLRGANIKKSVKSLIEVDIPKYKLELKRLNELVEGYKRLSRISVV